LKVLEGAHLDLLLAHVVGLALRLPADIEHAEMLQSASYNE
jgi:hypothetical protein